MMVLYEILLLTGGLGLAAMALLGFAHVGGAHSHGHVGPLGHGHGAGHLGPGSSGAHGGGGGHGIHVSHAGHAGHAGHVTHSGGTHAGNHDAAHGASREVGGMSLLSLLSPMTLFGACLGAGVVGSVLTRWGEPVQLAAVGAVIGAVGFNALLVRPVMRLVMGFASVPARCLAGTLMEPAEAVTAFDANGEGLVRVLIDGQSVDVLARLTDEERRQGARVLRGQSVRVEEVDPHTNRCKVSRL
jgi:hypothetical protein